MDLASRLVKMLSIVCHLNNMLTHKASLLHLTREELFRDLISPNTSLSPKRFSFFKKFKWPSMILKNVSEVLDPEM
jgi:hypothetical protein